MNSAQKRNFCGLSPAGKRSFTLH